MSQTSPAPAEGAEIIPLVRDHTGHRGTLRTAGGRELPVQGYERGEELVLVLLAGRDGSLCDEDLDPAVVEYTTARGVIRLQGDGHVQDPALVRFHPDGAPEVVQRRAFVRVLTPVAVTVESPPEAQHAYTIDLSGGGMLLSGAPGLTTGDTVPFEVRIETDPQPIRGVARVVRVHGDGRRALAFEQIEEGDRQRLIRFIFSCLRAGRAKTRGDHV